MYPDMTKNLEKFKEVDGKWPLFQITRLTRDPHTSKFQITSVEETSLVFAFEQRPVAQVLFPQMR